jgi:hypothetical protein
VVLRAKGEAVPEVQTDPVTGLLQQWVRGDEKALDILVPPLYQDLRRFAHHHLKSERADHALQSTALVNVAFLRLKGGNPVLLQSRGHFIAIASPLMRQIRRSSTFLWRRLSVSGRPRGYGCAAK